MSVYPSVFSRSLDANPGYSIALSRPDWPQHTQHWWLSPGRRRHGKTCLQKMHFIVSNMGVEPKIGGFSPKMDGLFHGKPYENFMIWGVFPLFLVQHPYVEITICKCE